MRDSYKKFLTLEKYIQVLKDNDMMKEALKDNTEKLKEVLKDNDKLNENIARMLEDIK